MTQLCPYIDIDKLETYEPFQDLNLNRPNAQFKWLTKAFVS